MLRGGMTIEPKRAFRLFSKPLTPTRSSLEFRRAAFFSGSFIVSLTTLRRAALGSLLLLPGLALASEGMNGAELSLPWAIPFAGILLSIALFPLFLPSFWHHHFGKVSLFWAAACAIPLGIAFGASAAFDEVIHILLADYLPFLIFVGALFTVAGGIHVRGSFVGRPIVNTAFLGLGAVLANLMGTTGAAMLLIRPLISANEGRTRKIHTFIFFIFLVANVGGALTPLGDPPLFLGFLRGVEFFWTAEHLFAPWIFTVAILLAIYFAIDSFMFKKDVAAGEFRPSEEKKAFGIDGKINILFLAVIVSAVLMSGIWNPGVEFTFLGVHFTLQNIARDVIFLATAGASVALTAKSVREANQFTWDPILEVGKLFFGIFVCMVPVLKMLAASDQGAFAPLVALVSNPDGSFNNTFYFWLTGSMSAFLDNAPTYLAYFSLAGGDPVELMTTHSHTLMAISLGSVFMGAMTYIGNAPNFMTVAICNERGVKMPTFFGYMMWSVGILGPVFLVMDLVFVA